MSRPNRIKLSRIFKFTFNQIVQVWDLCRQNISVCNCFIINGVVYACSNPEREMHVNGMDFLGSCYEIRPRRALEKVNLDLLLTKQVGSCERVVHSEFHCHFSLLIADPSIPIIRQICATVNVVSLHFRGAPLLVGCKKANHAHQQRSALSGVTLRTLNPFKSVSEKCLWLDLRGL